MGMSSGKLLSWLKHCLDYQNAVALVTIEVPSQRFLFRFRFFLSSSDRLLTTPLHKAGSVTE
jgi:hypothetical protein